MRELRDVLEEVLYIRGRTTDAQVRSSCDRAITALNKLIEAAT